MAIWPNHQSLSQKNNKQLLFNLLILMLFTQVHLRELHYYF